MDNVEQFKESINEISVIKYDVSQNLNKKLSALSKIFRTITGYPNGVFKTVVNAYAFDVLSIDTHILKTHKVLVVLGKDDLVISSFARRGFNVKLDPSVNDIEFLTQQFSDKKLKKLNKLFGYVFGVAMPESIPEIIQKIVDEASTVFQTINEKSDVTKSMTEEVSENCGISKGSVSKSVSLRVVEIKGGKDSAKEDIVKIKEKHDELIECANTLIV